MNKGRVAICPKNIEFVKRKYKPNIYDKFFKIRYFFGLDSKAA